MTRFVTFTVQVRPHGESIQLDGRTFTQPSELWAYLHLGASIEARKPEAVKNSVFLTSKDTDEWIHAMQSGGHEIEYSVPPGGISIQPKLVPARAKQLQPGVSKRTLEEMDL